MSKNYQLYAFQIGNQKFNFQGKYQHRTLLMKSIQETIEKGNIDYILVKIDQTSDGSSHHLPSEVQDAAKTI